MNKSLTLRPVRLGNLAAISAATVLGLLSPMASAIEEPKYSVVREYDGFEVREYAPYIVAEVVVPGPAEEAGNQGFRILAGYIFGGNKGERKIAMTAPVAQAPAPVRIEMTAPVSGSRQRRVRRAIHDARRVHTRDVARTPGPSGQAQEDSGWPLRRHPILRHVVRA